MNHECVIVASDGCQVFTDLSQDPTLFTGTNNYQFDIYRLMKKENRLVSSLPTSHLQV